MSLRAHNSTDNRGPKWASCLLSDFRRVAVFGGERGWGGSMPAATQILAVPESSSGCLVSELRPRHEDAFRPFCGIHYTPEMQRTAHTPSWGLCSKILGREGLPRKS